MEILIPKQIVRPVNPRGSNQPLPLKDCCKVEKNLTVLWVREDLRVTTCQECGHRYWRFWAEQGSLGAKIRG